MYTRAAAAASRRLSVARPGMPSPAAARPSERGRAGRLAQPERRLVSSGGSPPPSVPSRELLTLSHTDSDTRHTGKYTRRSQTMPLRVLYSRGPVRSARQLNRYKTASCMCRYCHPVARTSCGPPPAGRRGHRASLSVCLSVCVSSVVHTAAASERRRGACTAPLAAAARTTSAPAVASTRSCCGT